MIEIKQRWRIVSSVAFSGFAFIALLATVYAQQVSQKNSADDIVVQSKQLGAVPSSASSGSKVTLRLTFDAGKDTEVVFKVTQFEGSIIRVERNGSTVGIVPHIDTERGNQVTAKILKLVPVDARDISVGERIAEISSFEIGREASDLPIADFGVRVEVIGIAFEIRPPNERKKISQVHLLDEGGGIEGGRCCVTCSGIQVCGCAVEGPCGSCCTGSCC
jgi:hypothetical protein